MESLAVVFLAGLVVGYFVLAGCDIGLGMLMPYLARGSAERRRVASAIAPYFLGTEVWLVAAVGVVAAAFPELKSAVVVQQWPVFVALLAGWLWRDAGLWFRARVDARRWHGFWDAAVVAGSWTLALCWGLVLAALLGGTAFSVFGVVCAIAVALLFALRGAAFGAERLVPADESAVVPPHPLPTARAAAAVAPGSAAAPVAAAASPAAPVAVSASAADPAESADVAAQATRVLARAALGAVVLAIGAAVLSGGTAVGRPLSAVVVLTVLVTALASTSGLSGPRWSRHTSALAMAVPPLLVASAVELPGLESEPATLALVGAGVAPLLPVMVIGQIWLYRILRRPAVASGFFA
ncbi:cytochrome bd-type quinol oxidase subunit 2 [Spinactinospora alkalitolerans]|uniref:Cytochrome bd-type quinol oxidase subunit 2 n=1 Tax=Spinactinospora alkalitolerans TaxID=687207 RepID=A0A852TS67_9ACTN|nr:cytochrome d ubiquinol oxidase subunit II [Spinactinospora alkalitolerans]NYE46127.1 cytochrome bd-type quinol oxidase subunit 2 [Spinactinospora alkalitolerans]